MKAVLAALWLAACLSPSKTLASPWRFPVHHDAFLMENDLAYARFLALARDGTYRQINRDGSGQSAEVDEGTWEQDAAGALRLRSTCHAPRPRALSAGPLWVTITGQEDRDALPALLAAIRRLLRASADRVFDAGAAAELTAPGRPGVRVAGQAATFARADLESLAARIERALENERTGVYVLAPVRSDGPRLFALADSVFQEADLAAVRRDDQTPGDRAAAPFYFAVVDGPAFAREVGRWQPLHLPGGIP